MTNYLTINDFKSADLQKACRRADKNNSGGIDTDSEFKNLINSIHTNNPENYCPQGHIYEGTESEINLVHEAYDKYKNDISEKLIKEFKDLISKNKGLEKIFHESTKFNLLGPIETKNSKIINVMDTNISKFLNRTNEPSQKQLDAREKLYQLVASNGISYRNAQNNVAEIEKKYEKDCQSYYNQEQPQNLMFYRPPMQGFDPTKIPNEKDRDRYYASIRAMQEIEKNYSALFAETGLKATVMNDIANRTNKPNFEFNW